MAQIEFPKIYATSTQINPAQVYTTTGQVVVGAIVDNTSSVIYRVLGLDSDEPVGKGLLVAQLMHRTMFPPALERIDYHYQRGNHIIGDYKGAASAYADLGANIATFIIQHLKTFSALYQLNFEQYRINEINDGVENYTTENNRTVSSNLKNAYENAPLGTEAFSDISTPFNKNQQKNSMEDGFTETKSLTKNTPKIQLYEEFTRLNSFTNYQKKLSKFVDSLCAEYTTLL